MARIEATSSDLRRGPRGMKIVHCGAANNLQDTMSNVTATIAVAHGGARALIAVRHLTIAFARIV